MDLRKLTLITLVTVVLHQAYILFTDTTSIHGINAPNVRIWTFFLLLISLFIFYFILLDYYSSPQKNSKLFIIAIILAIGTSILRGFGFSEYYVVYGTFLLIINAIVFYIIVQEKHYVLKLYTTIFAFSWILLFADVYNLKKYFVSIFGPLFELFLIIGICGFVYKSKPDIIEYVILIIGGLIGYFVGQFVLSQDVPALILRTVFEQTLTLGEYSSTIKIIPYTTDMFFVLHFIEVFVVGLLLILRRSSFKSLTIIFAGFDLTYPPLSLIRIIALYLFFRQVGKETEGMIVSGTKEQGWPEK